MRLGGKIALAAVALVAAAAGYVGAVHFDHAVDTVGGPEARTRLAKRDCGFTTDSGRTLACYDFFVPETRGKAGGRMIMLPVLVFEAPASDGPKKPDPVLLISGGPGAISYTEKRFADMWKGKFKELAWLKGRDLIVYDQRGVGGARPALECPEVDSTRDDPLNLERARVAMIACRDRLQAEGVDLAAYDTNANVADILSLRRAMGLAAWNLWGQSYGTRVALTLLRGDVEGVRAVILDGTYPPEVAGKLYLASAFRQSLGRVFDACAEDETCARDYPNLARRFEDVLRRLRATPSPVKSDPSPLLPPRVFDVNDVIFLSVVDSMLYTADGIGKLPWLIDRLADGKDDALADPLVDWDLVSFGPFITAGVSFLVDCNDTPETDDADEQRAARQFPHLKPWLDYALTFKPCPLWNPRQAPALDRAPVRSDVPALILAGWFDIATPPEWGRLAANSLKRGQYVPVRAASHDAADAACAQSALATFLNDPGADVTRFCGPTPRHPEFKKKSDDE